MLDSCIETFLVARCILMFSSHIIATQRVIQDRYFFSNWENLWINSGLHPFKHQMSTCNSLGICISLWPVHLRQCLQLIHALVDRLHCFHSFRIVCRGERWIRSYNCPITIILSARSKWWRLNIVNTSEGAWTSWLQVTSSTTYPVISLHSQLRRGVCEGATSNLGLITI